MKIPLNERKVICSLLKQYVNKSLTFDDIEKIINEITNKIKITFDNEQRIKHYICKFIYEKDDSFILDFSKDRKKSIFNINNIDNDKLGEIELKRTEIVKQLKSIIYPAQRTLQWYNQRKAMITASDGGTVLDMNEHEEQYKFIIKKITNLPFKGNKFCYHGKKYEKIALMIYENKLNVKVADFGLVQHIKYPFIGASPDGIVDLYKLDGKSKTKYVGRMIEIKCPLSRKIKTKGKNICPLYYWVQVQLQLETCDLDECDFWQCSISEYENKEEFEKDTKDDEKYKSQTNGLEKGCLIQLIENGIANYYDNVYEHAIFIYPPKLQMSPEDCQKWISDEVSTFKEKKEYSCYSIDKIIYWRIELASCYLIKRDKDWFNKYLATFEKMWNYVTFLREHETEKNMFIKFVDKLQIKDNGYIMNVVEKLYNKDETVKEEMKKVIDYDGYIPPED